MMKKISVILIVGASVFLVSCKSKKIQVSPGAYVTTDGSKDGLSHVQSEFKTASQTDEGIRVTLDSDVLFPSNSSYLSEKAKKELDKLVRVLKSYDHEYSLLVEGHTDATGTADYNQTLSEKRARSVKEYLINQKIVGSKIKTAGFGLSKPIAPNNTAEGRAKNRRVDILIQNR